MKKFLTVVLAGVLFSMLPMASAHAGEVDILLDKLVEKGILSPVEASIIKDETKQSVTQELIEKKSYSVPSWVQKVKLKGDARLRYQYERRNSDTEGRERGRVRYRLGIIANPLKNVEVGAGLASGGTDPRSTNDTFENAFETGDVRLDYAYVQYALNENISMIGGKFARKAWLWAPSDLLWDGDITPEGGSIAYNGSLNSSTDFWVNSGVWVIDHYDQVDETDPFMTYVQGGLKWGQDNLDAKLAATGYSFNGLKGSASIQGSGNTYEGGVRKYDYDSYSIAGEFGVKKLFGGLPYGIDNRIAVFGEYIHNPDPEENSDGYAVGVKVGHKKVSKPNTWQLKYLYANLEKDAWVDEFPDSDRYGGATDVKSHEVVLSYAPMSNVTLGLDYYNSDRIEASSNKEHIVQADVVVKF